MISMTPDQPQSLQEAGRHSVKTSAWKELALYISPTFWSKGLSARHLMIGTSKGMLWLWTILWFWAKKHKIISCVTMSPGCAANHWLNIAHRSRAWNQFRAIFSFYDSTTSRGSAMKETCWSGTADLWINMSWAETCYVLGLDMSSHTYNLNLYQMLTCCVPRTGSVQYMAKMAVQMEQAAVYIVYTQ